MSLMRKHYTVKELSQLSGVSVRTLHHYDEIGLLSPEARSSAGYRLYGKKQILRLQQVLFYRELEVPLKEIARILDDPEFDEAKALEQHREALQRRQRRYGALIATINKTLRRLKGEEMVSDQDLYSGFSKEKLKKYEKEMKEKFSAELMAEADRNVKAMTKSKWANVQQQGDEIARELVSLMKLDPACEEVQAVIAKHHAWVENFYGANSEIYQGLSELYLEHPDFRCHYDKFQPGLTEFLSRGMVIFAKESLSGE